MKQDRRLNGWIFIASIIEILSAMVFIASGVALGVLGFLNKNLLAKIDDLQLFLAQDLFTQFKLKSEYLYLFVGIALAVVGLLLLIFAILSLAWAKKHKVVRRKGRIFIFSLFDLAVAGLAGAYLFLGYKDLTKSLLSFKEMTDVIKYVMYGIAGAFAFIWLCKMLGIIFGRSEKFMSNDNSKYAFANKARARKESAMPPVQRPVSQGQYAQRPVQPVQQAGQYVPQQSPNMTQAPQRPVTSQRPVGAPQRPAGMPQRPMGQPRPQNMQASQRPVTTQRPVGAPQRPTGMPQRPQGAQPNNMTSNVNAKRFCPKCGKLLGPQERVCTICGRKPN